MRFELTILGSSGATPFKDRFPTAQVLNVHEQLFLIDCGEGTQIRLSEYQVKRGKINRVFISHLHGDHVFGLPGLLTSFGLNKRETPVHIHSPALLKGMVDAQFPYNDEAPFPIYYHEHDTEKSNLIFENEILTVETIPLRHRIPCAGFVFRTKPGDRKMIKEKITEYDIHFSDIPRIKAGADYTTDKGEVISNDELTLPPLPGKSFAFCSDTAYLPEIVPLIKGVDLLYHEATFLHKDLEKAKATAHSTALQAALIAKEAHVGKLIIGHYSARYENLEEHLKEARAVFPETYLGQDGMTYSA